MKKGLQFTLIGLALLLSFGGTALAQSTSGFKCDTNGANCTYVPLEPLSKLDESGNMNLVDFLSSLFKILFSISGLIAVAMLTAGGIEYMVSDVAERKNEGLARARGAIYGMLILAGSWLLLNTINPDLLKLDIAFPQSASSAAPSVSESAASPSSNAIYRKFPASSELASGLAKQQNLTLRDTATMGAVLYIDRQNIKLPETTAVLKAFRSECNAGGIGTAQSIETSDKKTFAIFCESTPLIQND